jgi:hypothetical protein
MQPLVQQRDKGWTAELDSRQRQNFRLFRNVQTGSGAQAASYPMGTGVFLRE